MYEGSSQHCFPFLKEIMAVLWAWFLTVGLIGISLVAGGAEPFPSLLAMSLERCFPPKAFAVFRLDCLSFC